MWVFPGAGPAGAACKDRSSAPWAHDEGVARVSAPWLRMRAAEQRAALRRSTVEAETVRHEMHIAKVSPRTAKQRGLSSNHHARVWCECQSQQTTTPGSIASGPYADPDRPAAAVRRDPRRLGAWDDLGVVDLREPGSAIALYHEHLREYGWSTGPTTTTGPR